MAGEEKRNASHLIRIVHHLRFARMRTFHQRDGIFPGQPPVLRRLYSGGEMSQRELAAALDQTPASMTVTLGRMEKSGLVSRRTDPADKRIQRVSITDKGRAVCERAFQSEAVVAGEMFKGFTDGEIEAISGYMIRCAENLARVTGKPRQGERMYDEYLRHVGRLPDMKEEDNERVDDLT